MFNRSNTCSNSVCGSDARPDLVPSQIRVVVVPPVVVNHTEDNVITQEHYPVIGAAYECK